MIIQQHHTNLSCTPPNLSQSYKGTRELSKKRLTPFRNLFYKISYQWQWWRSSIQNVNNADKSKCQQYMKNW